MTAALTAFALVAFAANSLLCRMALGTSAIDAASFTSIRLASGAAALLVLGRLSSGRHHSPGPPWRSAIALFAYALSFSLAYESLETGTGALVLFGSVQATMLGAALATGERPRRQEWVGLALAAVGLVYLVFPGLTAPPLGGSALMTVSGISWGCYSLWGRRATDPIGDTALNFTRGLPLAVLVSLATVGRANVSAPGAMLAVLSGALASGLGYVVWYYALPRLTATRAATVQLAVPVLAAVGGVAVLSEGVSLRLFVSGLLILGGVALASSSNVSAEAP